MGRGGGERNEGRGDKSYLMAQPILVSLGARSVSVATIVVVSAGG